MILTINYPSSIEECYAAGIAEGGIFFEVPAIFRQDGTCDETATYDKVNIYLISTYGPKQ